MNKGIYTLANDVVYDHLVALLNSLEVNGAKDIPVYVIPYDNRLEKVKAEIASRNNVSLFDNIDSINFWEDFATQAWTSHQKAQKIWRAKGWQPVHCLGMHRKFCCFDGPFEKFIYFDADTLLMGDIDYIYQKLDECDWVANDFQYKSDISYVFDSSSEVLFDFLYAVEFDERTAKALRAQRKESNQVMRVIEMGGSWDEKLKSKIFCAGFFASKKGVLNLENLGNLLPKLKAGEAEVMSVRGTDQPLF